MLSGKIKPISPEQLWTEYCYDKLCGFKSTLYGCGNARYWKALGNSYIYIGHYWPKSRYKDRKFFYTKEEAEQWVQER